MKIMSFINKGPIRVLSLTLALLMAFFVFWDPSQFAAKTSSLEVWQGLALIWAICTGVIYGVGFKPTRLLWQIIFCPLPAVIILIIGLVYIF